MNYTKNKASKFAQSNGKMYCLNPAIKRAMPKIKNGKMLEVGCGKGFYQNYLLDKKYNYTGIDISVNMIKEAKKNNPKAKFMVTDALKLAEKLPRNYYDIALSSMVFIEFSSANKIKKVLEQIKYVLKKDGILVIGIPHPCFSMYMKKYLFNDKDGKTNFKGYFKSGAKFKLYSQSLDMTFTDYHYTIEDYISMLNDTGFTIKKVDECKPLQKAKTEVGTEFYEQRANHPSYMVITAKG